MNEALLNRIKVVIGNLILVAFMGNMPEEEKNFIITEAASLSHELKDAVQTDFSMADYVKAAAEQAAKDVLPTDALSAADKMAILASYAAVVQTLDKHDEEEEQVEEVELDATVWNMDFLDGKMGD